MKQYQNCPKCNRNKFRIIKGLCQSCYITLYNKSKFVRKYPKDIEITNIQKEFLTGCLLGDGWIRKINSGKNYPNFGIDRNQKDLDYLKWQYEFVKNLCSDNGIILRDRYNKTTKKTQKSCRFETRYLPSLLEFRKKWYPFEKKIVPNELKLTKLVMQIWYCDDGSLEIASPKSFRIKLSTHGFTKKEVMFLVSLLHEKYGDGFSIIKDSKEKEQYFIRANTKASTRILNDLKDGFPPGMKRKLDLEKIKI